MSIRSLVHVAPAQTGRCKETSGGLLKWFQLTTHEFMSPNKSARGAFVFDILK